MAALPEHAGTSALVFANAALGIAVLLLLLLVLVAVVRHVVSRRRRFTRAVREADAEMRTMFPRR